MSFIFRKFIFIIIFNFSLFLILIIGIQNSSSQKKVNLIFGETVRLPISFIVGISLISGSIAGGVLNINQNNKE